MSTTSSTSTTSTVTIDSATMSYEQAIDAVRTLFGKPLKPKRAEKPESEDAVQAKILRTGADSMTSVKKTGLDAWQPRSSTDTTKRDPAVPPVAPAALLGGAMSGAQA